MPGRAGAELDGEPMQYADLAEWQNELLEDAPADAAVPFSRRHAALELPLQNGRSAAAFSPRASARALESESSARVAALAAEHGTSESTVLLACWQVLLARLCGVEELVVGVTCDGRSYEGLDVALGLLARDLPLSCRIDADTSFAGVLRDTDKALEEVLENQEYFSWDSLPAVAAHEPRAGYFPAGYGFEDWVRKIAQTRDPATRTRLTRVVGAFRRWFELEPSFGSAR